MSDRIAWLKYKNGRPFAVMLVLTSAVAGDCCHGDVVVAMV